jgi:hypothetical protein
MPQRGKLIAAHKKNLEFLPMEGRGTQSNRVVDRQASQRSCPFTLFQCAERYREGEEESLGRNS